MNMRWTRPPQMQHEICDAGLADKYLEGTLNHRHSLANSCELDS